MASVDWMKCKGGRDAKAKFWHCDEQKRLNHQHANKQIDKTRTHLNMSFGAFADGYDAVCKLYDETIAELDAQPGANKRQDRVTCVGWTLPAPEGMSEKQAREWMADAYETLKARYGDCMLGGTAHFDEVHEYRDAETGEKRQSRPHLHVYAVPIVDGKLNGKSFTARRHMLAMNSAIERMTQEDFPGFKFQNGTKKKSRKSVEELKNDSERAEIIAEAKAEASRIIDNAQEHVNGVLSNARLKADKIVENAKETAQKASDELVEARTKELNGRIADYNSAVQALNAREAAIAVQEKELVEREKVVTESSSPTYTAKKMIELIRRMMSNYKPGTPDGNTLGRLLVHMDKFSKPLDAKYREEMLKRRTRGNTLGADIGLNRQDENSHSM